MRNTRTLSAAVVMLAALLAGCASNQKTFVLKEKVAISEASSVGVGMDCSVVGVDAEWSLKWSYPPTAGHNESICKILSARLSTRLKEGTFSRAFSDTVPDRVSIGRVYVKTMTEETIQDFTEKADKSDDPKALDLKRATLEYLNSGPIDLAQAELGAQRDALQDSVMDFLVLNDPRYAGDASHGVNRKLVGMTVPGFSDLASDQPDYMLFFKVNGFHLLSQQATEDVIARKAADVAIMTATCLLGACTSVGLGNDITPTIHVRPILVSKTGTVVWTSAAIVAIQPEDSVESVVSRLVEGSMPMDMIKLNPAKATVGQPTKNGKSPALLDT
jgi:hypothetical protein